MIDHHHHHHHKNGRRGSWDSKMSVSTISSANKNFRRSPSSILSSDSDIRFTRKKLSDHYRCGCFIIAGFLFFLLLCSVVVYIGYTFLLAEPPEELVFRGTFRVVAGDAYSPELADPVTEQFRLRSRDYRERLNLLFRRSNIRPAFVGTEILALDGDEDKDLIVHFNVHIDPRYADVRANDLSTILSREIALEESLFLGNLTIDATSLDIRESNMPSLPTLPMYTPNKAEPATSTVAPPPPRRCTPIDLPYCSKLPYNTTTYPNILGHESSADIAADMIAFRELVDAECYRLAYDFVCQLLQPACSPSLLEDELVAPCRSFCRDFISGCGDRLPARFKERLDCGRFPEYTGTGSCRPKPGCIKNLQSRSLSSRVCDGIADCTDLQDEQRCSYCSPGYLHCGLSRTCIPPGRRCDGKPDCPDGSDERACLQLAPSISRVSRHASITPHQMLFHSEGFVVFNEKGELGKLCSENLNHTLPSGQMDNVLRTVATSLCNTLSYQGVKSVLIKEDNETNIPYVSMKNPTDAEILFVRSPCVTKQVMHVACDNLECGLQSVRESKGIQGLAKMSAHGDWPWHAALFKEDVHICDGTLVSPEWLVTTTSCFQGQARAEWTARFGSVRLSSTSPWQQERRIVGMVKSPVEGSTIAMVKLEEPVFMSDFVRPACLPKKGQSMQLETSYCNTLGWARNRDQLQRVQLKVADMQRCENLSITTVNSLCTESTFFKEDCNEEEVAGSPMLCLQPDGFRWAIIGVSNWRIACPRAGVDRPRMYDKIISNVDWIHQTIAAGT